jgi:hypothetical protein
MLVRAGADLHDDDTDYPLDAALPRGNEKDLRAAVDFLRSQNYWAWSPWMTPNITNTPRRGNILTAASCAGCLEYVMAAIDVLHFPLSQLTYALDDAAQGNHLEVMAILLKLGAQAICLSGCSSCQSAPDVKDLPAHGTLIKFVSREPLVHCFLFHWDDLARQRRRSGADVLWWTMRAALQLRETPLWWLTDWRFQELEGILLHILLHSRPDFDIGHVKWDWRRETHQDYHSPTLLYIVQLWSILYRPFPGDPNMLNNAGSDVVDWWLENPSTSITWSLRGFIRKRKRDEVHNMELARYIDGESDGKYPGALETNGRFSQELWMSESFSVRSSPNSIRRSKLRRTLFRANYPNHPS